jgi:hypothetical protein
MLFPNYLCALSQMGRYLYLDIASQPHHYKLCCKLSIGS